MYHPPKIIDGTKNLYFACGRRASGPLHVWAPPPFLFLFFIGKLNTAPSPPQPKLRDRRKL